MIKLTAFMGEIPAVDPRLLPNEAATLCENAWTHTGALEPMSAPLPASGWPGTVGVGTFYIHDSVWLTWPGIVDAAPGPVNTSRLYIFGDGPPRVRIPSGVVRDLQLPAPAPTMTARLVRSQQEALTIEGVTVPLRQNIGVATPLGGAVRVQISGGSAIVTVNYPAGLTQANAAAVLNSVGYLIGGSGAFPPGVRYISLTSIRDNQAQQYDANKNPIGSPVSYFEDVIGAVRVAGTTQIPVLPSLIVGDNTNNPGWNDPPIVSVTQNVRVYANRGDPAVFVFSGAVVNTIEGPPQLINQMVLKVDGLANGIVDPALEESILYTYTHVTDLDEESEPATLTPAVQWSPGQVVALNNFDAGNAARGVNRYRIYRSQTDSAGQTNLYFVTEVPRGTTGIYDEVIAKPAAEALPSGDFNPPPAGLIGLVAMPNGMMAAFAGREIFFCEPYKPHAWPVKYVLRAEFPIVGMAAIGSGLAILTTGNPYIAQGSHPSSMVMQRLEVNLPCVSTRRGIVDMGYAVAYPTNEGIAVIDSNGARVVTTAVISPKTFRINYRPQTIVAAKFDAFYLFSYIPPGEVDRVTAMIDLSSERPELRRTSEVSDCFHVQEGSGRLLFLRRSNNTVYIFDYNTGGAVPYEWRSKPYVDEGHTNLGACMILDDTPLGESNAGTVTLEIYGDQALRATVTEVNRIVTLPSGYRARQWQFVLKGTRKINGVILAHTASQIAKAMAG
jgi:hypothetical protein